ncbi:MAG: T9SS type A sorting domain-containing protein [Edaphocola sp.]
MTFYLNSYIDDEDYYDTIVANGIAANMISEDEFADSLFVGELIEKVKVVALEPYLIGMTSETMNKVMAPNINLQSVLTKVYPNPTKSNTTIIAGDNYIDGQNITANLYDMMGKLVYSVELKYTKGRLMSCDIKNPHSGNY